MAETQTDIVQCWRTGRSFLLVNSAQTRCEQSVVISLAISGSARRMQTSIINENAYGCCTDDAWLLQISLDPLLIGLIEVIDEGLVGLYKGKFHLHQHGEAVLPVLISIPTCINDNTSRTKSRRSRPSEKVALLLVDSTSASETMSHAVLEELDVPPLE